MKSVGSFMVVVSLKAVLNHQDWALVAGSLHVDGKGIVVAKMISEQGSRWLRAKVLKEACREGKPGEARITSE